MSNEFNSLRRFSKYKIDVEKKILWFDNSVCEVPGKAVEMLCVLIESRGGVVTKEELLNKVWQDSFVEESVLPQNIYFLRKLFREHGIKETLIQTIPRKGYRFAGELTEEFEEETIIEREVFERKLIAESDLTDEELERIFNEKESSENSDIINLDKQKQIEIPAKTKTSPKRFPLYPAVLILSVTLIVFLGVFVIYPNFFKKDSAKAFPIGTPNVKYERISESGRVVSIGLSPDNQHAVYAVNTQDKQYEMILQHLPTQSETIIIKPQKHFLANIRFSPDGNYIYYSGKDKKDRPTIYKMPLYGGISEPVLQDYDSSFNLSPDGEWLAFLRRMPDIPAHYLEIARSRDGSDRRIVTIRKDKGMFKIWGTAPDWSPDGKKLIAAALTKQDDETKPEKNHLVEIDLGNGKQKNIKTPKHWRSVHEPYYAPDGKSIYLKVREDVGEPVQIHQFDIATGKSRNLTNDTNDYREFRIASDESFLMTATWSKSENLFLVSAENPNKIKQLTFDTQGQNGNSGLVWTVDGKNLVYTRTKGFGIGNIWLMNVETGETRQLTKEEKASQNQIDRTPDGESIVYSSSRNGSYQVWRMDFDGTNQKRLTDEKYIMYSQVSKDGKWFYYSGNGLSKMPIEGGNAVKLMDGNPADIKFSPIDSKIFSALYNDEKEKRKKPWMRVIFNLDSLPEYKDLELTESSGIIDWAPNGKKIYYIGSGENVNNVWTVSPETLEKEQVTNFQDQRIARGSLSPDGRTLALSRGIATGNIVKVSGF